VELGEREKGKKNDRASVISHTIGWEGSRYKDVYLKLLQNTGWEEKV
jgi:hypothetical protein